MNYVSQILYKYKYGKFGYRPFSIVSRGGKGDTDLGIVLLHWEAIVAGNFKSPLQYEFVRGTPAGSMQR
jgi:hypothetical protein